ncbi:hypothetical protein K438DRAFT_776531 [Mycena galopus ATCC 62051]|nr:hypothetical protein K438DRAFT_776531 [Mycena galopus ATCC 62051]
MRAGNGRWAASLPSGIPVSLRISAALVIFKTRNRVHKIGLILSFSPFLICGARLPVVRIGQMPVNTQSPAAVGRRGSGIPRCSVSGAFNHQGFVYLAMVGLNVLAFLHWASPEAIILTDRTPDPECLLSHDTQPCSRAANVWMCLAAPSRRLVAQSCSRALSARGIRVYR